MDFGERDILGIWKESFMERRRFGRIFHSGLEARPTHSAHELAALPGGSSERRVAGPAGKGKVKVPCRTLPNRGFCRKVCRFAVQTTS